jgi:hypothetical protein
MTAVNPTRLSQKWSAPDEPLAASTVPWSHGGEPAAEGTPRAVDSLAGVIVPVPGAPHIEPPPARHSLHMGGELIVEPVDVGKVAHRLGVDQTILSRIIFYDTSFPDPYWIVNGVPAWDWFCVASWARAMVLR